MDQKQRDKIAWVLAIVLGLVLIYLLAVNVFKVGKKRTPPPPSTIALALPAQPASPFVSEKVKSQAPETALDLKVLAEQQQIAARLPRRNPFSTAEAGQSRPLVKSGTEGGSRPLGESGTVDNEIKLKVTAIVSRQGSNKRIAMINGNMLEEGDSIGEWTIIKVNPKNVVLGNGAQQMVVGVK